MEKSKALTIAVIGLLLLNIGILTFLVVGPRPFSPPPPRHDRSRLKEMMMERLQLNADQTQAYEDLISLHRQKVRQLEDRLMELRNESFMAISDEDSLKDAQLITAIDSVNHALQVTHIDHFKKLYQLCSAEQKQLLKPILAEVAHHLKPQNEHPPHGPR
ncbi:MAG: hypothetical protein CFE24_04305 [Flavobacterium sp. BFFFF2]|nr:MAG: hypothetical protein CFE24_04305 [Flavobacterium sp. BFFFF2]